MSNTELAKTGGRAYANKILTPEHKISFISMALYVSMSYVNPPCDLRIAALSIFKNSVNSVMCGVEEIDPHLTDDDMDEGIVNDKVWQCIVATRIISLRSAVDMRRVIAAFAAQSPDLVCKETATGMLYIKNIRPVRHPYQKTYAAEAQRIFTALSGMSRTEMLQKAKQELDINKEQMDKVLNTHMGR